MTAVILDIGNVVLTWRPERLAPVRFTTLEAMAAELEAAGFRTWFDAGAGAWEDRLAELDDSAQVELFARYLDGLTEALADPVPGMADLTAELTEEGVPLFALTNATVEADTLVRRLHAGVMARFSDVFVSGREGVAKPQPEAFERLLARNGLNADETIFVDDTPAYAQGAAALGLATHVFTSAEALRAALRDRGVL